MADFGLAVQSNDQTNVNTGAVRAVYDNGDHRPCTGAGLDDSGDTVGETMVPDPTDKDKKEISVIPVGIYVITLSFISVNVKSQQNRRRFQSVLKSGLRGVFCRIICSGCATPCYRNRG